MLHFATARSSARIQPRCQLDHSSFRRRSGESVLSSNLHSVKFDDRQARHGQPHSSKRRDLLPCGPVGALVIFVAAALAFFVTRMREPSPQELVRRGEERLNAGDAHAALELAQQALAVDPASARGLLLAARACVLDRQPAQAFQYLGEIPDSSAEQAVTARCLSGDLLMQSGRLSEAEQQFRRAVQYDGECELAIDRLAYLLGLTSRSWEALPYRLRLLQLGDVSRVKLIVLSLGDLAHENPELIEASHQAAPRDPAVLLAVARGRIETHDYSGAIDLLQELTAEHPDLIEAQIKLGRVLLERGPQRQFQQWRTRLPTGAEDHPGAWAIRGAWAEETGDEMGAARCYSESVRRDPNQVDTNYRLGQMLTALQRTNDAQPFFDRSEAIQHHLYLTHMVHEAPEGRDLAELEDVAKSAESLGLLWEALGWAKVAASRDRPPRWADEMIDRLQSQVRELPLVRTAPAFNPANRLDLSDVPLPEIRPDDADDSIANESSDDRLHDVAISFDDLARSLGLEFTYANGHDAARGGSPPLFEQLGGGAAVIDFDCDEWPDLYLTQGSDAPPGEAGTGLDDRLFRNVAGSGWTDVTGDVRAIETGFSQGVAVGDMNADGFPDVYVANIGRNRLFQNNGDGTFSDVTERAGLTEEAWTSSCAIADLNGDGLPEIFDVNYLSGSDLFTRECVNAEGAPRPCFIQSFAAAVDRLHVSRGDGSFMSGDPDSGVEIEGGRGLGIVVADFDGSGFNSLFLANDASPNFYHSNQTASRGAPPRFRELAMPLGLAVNGAGEQEACMGVAAGDADNDGKVDLFVTNFQGESNTLYVQAPGGVYEDWTLMAGLHDASFDLLGFGTQFVDADLDGNLDLMVTNGHIVDGRSQGGDYRMPPQFFYNTGGGRFLAIPADAIGRFFRGRYLGRGMARLDWNRDGRDDLAVSHIGDPAALLTNTSPEVGGFLSIKLIGTQSGRDAVGARVVVRTADGETVHLVTAGDGFQCSNERRLTIGVGGVDQIGELRIEWPSGSEDSFFDLAVNQEWLVCEGRGLLSRPGRPFVETPQVSRENP